MNKKERRKKKYRRTNMIRECDVKAKKAKRRIRIGMSVLIFASVGPFESEARRTNTVTSFDLYP